jgi:pimeloyl-ACP methyl ester carboxylesterase
VKPFTSPDVRIHLQASPFIYVNVIDPGNIPGGYADPMGLDLPELEQIDLEGPVAYRRWDGPTETTFVLVHGLGGLHQNWVRVAPGLAGLGQVLALDLPGFGASPLGRRGARVMDLRRTLDRFVRTLATGATIVVGNSMGGAIGILQAAVAPETLAGLVLTSPALPKVGRIWQHPSFAAALALYDVPVLGTALATTRVRSLDAERLVRLGFRITTADPDSIPDDVVRLHVEGVRAHQDDPGAVTAFEQATRSVLALGRRPDLTARALDNVRCPVLLLHGRRDRLVPASYAEAVLDRYPSWRGRIFPDLGHVAQLEAPGRWLSEVADWFAEEIR